MINRDMPSWRERFRNEYLAARFVEYPLIRMLLFNFWFRLVFLALILLSGTLCISFPKIWRTTPDGFLPVVKVSLIDFVQAAMLRRTALKEEVAGRWEEAAQAWRMAAANNMGNPDLSRGLLEAIVHSQNPKDRIGLALGQSSWLLRLTSTNALDVELVSKVYETFHLPELVVYLLESREKQLSPELAFRFLKALAYSRQVERFAKSMASASPPNSPTDEWRLFQAAYQAGWGAPGSIAQAWERLKQAQQNPALRETAHRMQMLVSLHLSDSTRYASSFQALVDLKADTAEDHVHYWRLLALLGKNEEAVKLAKAYPKPPISASDLIQLTQGFIGLGLRAQAVAFIKQHISEFAYSPSAWMTYADLLIEEKEWGELLPLAAMIRQHSQPPELLMGYSYYLQGYAEAGLNRVSVAEELFQKAVQYDLVSPAYSLRIARQVMKLGYPKPAEVILNKLAQTFGQDVEYWTLVWDNGQLLRNASAVLRAASAIYELKPQEAAAINNYAAALITMRLRPEEAVRLTVQYLALFPRSALAIINHAQALLLNQRVPEAGNLLMSLEADKLNAIQQVAYYYARLELHVLRGEFDQARQCAAKIDRQHLFPEEIAKLNQWEKQIAAPR